MQQHAAETFQNIIRVVEELRSGGQRPKIGFVSGNFNVIHPGHLRLLKFAEDCCDVLIVAVHNDSNDGVLVPQNYRLEGVQSIGCVHHAFILEDNVAEAIARLRPDIIVKGKEHESAYNVEKGIVDGYGGKLIFSAGEAVFSSLDLIRDEMTKSAPSADAAHDARDFTKRHGLSRARMEKIVNTFSDLSILVIGELIIDEYITCDVLGLSREDPSIVLTPLDNRKFVGAAGIVASHAAGMGAKTCYVSVCGRDAEHDFARDKLKDYGVEAVLLQDDSRPTTLKQRFRADGKTMMRLSHLKQHAISAALQKEILTTVRARIDTLDLLMFSDFNYGILPQKLVDDICDLCREKNVPMVADSQSSSQLGDISRFKNMRLIKPTEIEARLAVQNQSIGLVRLVEMLREKCGAEHILLTMASEGVLVHTRTDGEQKWPDDRLPAFNTMPKDTAGAGDAMFVSAALCLSSGASIWEAAYIGSIASGCQVGRIGNIPLSHVELKAAIEKIEGGDDVSLRIA